MRGPTAGAEAGLHLGLWEPQNPRPLECTLLLPEPAARLTPTCSSWSPSCISEGPSSALGLRSSLTPTLPACTAWRGRTGRGQLPAPSGQPAPRPTQDLRAGPQTAQGPRGSAGLDRGLPGGRGQACRWLPQSYARFLQAAHSQAHRKGVPQQLHLPPSHPDASGVWGLLTPGRHSAPRSGQCRCRVPPLYLRW